MGCDIHAFAEIKVNNEWHCYSKLSIDRWYRLFERMAGVRASGEVEPIALPRGLPSDVSVVTALECQDDDGHSHSFLSADEVVKVEAWAREAEPGRPYALFGYVFGNSWDDTKYRPKSVQDARLVFWFDN